MKKRTLIGSTLAACALVLGPVLQAEDAIDVERIWDKNCKKCHASDGTGNTRAGKKLRVRDYTDPAVQATFSDEEAFKLTMEGVMEEGSGKELMKAYKDELTEAEVHALVAYIRAFAKPA